MVETLQKEIKVFIAQSCESYLLTTDKQIRDLAIKLDSDLDGILDLITQTEFECILERELIPDFNIFYELTGSFVLAQLTIDLANEMEMSLYDILNKYKDIKVYLLSFEEFIEFKILVEKIFGEVRAEDLEYFDYEQIWEDKFQDNHYRSGHNCIVEFIKEN